MRGKIIILTVFYGLLASAVLGTNWIKPSKAGDSAKLVGGAVEWNYNKIDSANHAEWKVKSAGTYRLLVRIQPDKKGSFTLFIDDEKYKTVDVTAKKSEKYNMSVRDGKPFPISEAKALRIKLDKGSHVVRVESESEMFVRLVKIPKADSPISPDSYDKALVLITGDKTTTYFSASQKKPVVLTYDGARTISVWSRLAFDKKMKGVQHYTVVADNNGTIKRVKFETTISSTSKWENDGSVIPGKAKVFDLKLGKGKNILKLWCEETTAPYCVFRFTIKK